MATSGSSGTNSKRISRSRLNWLRLSMYSAGSILAASPTLAVDEVGTTLMDGSAAEILDSRDVGGCHDA
jgi:hypothetical protein